MIHIGRTNKLEIINFTPHGASLDAKNLGIILLPKRYLQESYKVGDFINVFIYFDSKQRLTATTQRVKVEVGNVAFLKVKQVNQVGAFLDWGLSKDLLVPFNQQQISMTVDKFYLVYVYFDEESNRIVASSRLNRFIEHNSSKYSEGQAVELSISDITDLGYSAVINNQHWGLLFFADVVKALKVGQRLKGYIKHIRDDGKINLSLEARGYEKVISLSTKILKQLENNDGYIPLSDKSPADLIYQQFNVSKKSFKMTIGSLYKKRLITITKEGITLVNNAQRTE